MTMTIRAPPTDLGTKNMDLCFRALTCFSRWHEWNTFVTSAEFINPERTLLKFQVRLGPLNTTSLERLVRLDPPHRAEWHYAEEYKGITASRIWEFRRGPEGTVVVESWETFGGWLGFTIWWMKGWLEEGFARMQEDLKAYVAKLEIEEQEVGGGKASE